MTVFHTTKKCLLSCRYPDQVSHTIYLEKSKLYYIEGVEKQNGGLGHLSVGVILPSDKKVFPIAKKYLRTNDKGKITKLEVCEITKRFTFQDNRFRTSVRTK